MKAGRLVVVVVVVCLYVKGGSSSLWLRKMAGSGSASQGGNTFPCSLEERSKMVFSPVGSWRAWRGPLGFGGGLDEAAADGPGEGFLRVSASAMRSWHLRFKRDFSAAVGASLTAFMYSSAAWMAWLSATLPVVSTTLSSCSYGKGGEPSALTGPGESIEGIATYSGASLHHSQRRNGGRREKLKTSSVQATPSWPRCKAGSAEEHAVSDHDRGRLGVPGRAGAKCKLLRSVVCCGGGSG